MLVKGTLYVAYFCSFCQHLSKDLHCYNMPPSSWSRPQNGGQQNNVTEHVIDSHWYRTRLWHSQCTVTAGSVLTLKSQNIHFLNVTRMVKEMRNFLSDADYYSKISIIRTLTIGRRFTPFRSYSTFHVPGIKTICKSLLSRTTVPDTCPCGRFRDVFGGAVYFR